MSSNNENSLEPITAWETPDPDLIKCLDDHAFKTIGSIMSVLLNVRKYLKSRGLLLSKQWTDFEDWLNNFSVKDPTED